LAKNGISCGAWFNDAERDFALGGGEGMSLYELMLSRRSVRQFKPEPVPEVLLKNVVNAARLAPSAAKCQPLEFIVVTEESLRGRIFSCLSWASYITPQGDPEPGQEPQAYIVILVNLRVRKKGFERDVGAAAENMILAAWEKGVGSCWLLSINRERMRSLLKVPEHYRIDTVLALGFPAETPVLEEMTDSVQYWKDQKGCLHVPKRKLEDVVHLDRF
jgi:nitroreductase